MSGTTYGRFTIYDGTPTGAAGVALNDNFTAIEDILTHDNYIIVFPDGSPTENVTTLRAAYTAAKALTPNGNALSATNRAAVLLMPGVYDFGTGDGSNNGLLMDGEFVDLIGIGNRDSVYLTSQNATSGKGTLQQTADNVHISNLTLHINSAQSGASAYHPDTNKPNTVIRNVVFDQDVSARAMRMNIIYSGTYENCLCMGSGGFGTFGTASGTFNNCTHTGDHGFGGDGTASGTFNNCTHTGFGGFGDYTV